MSTCWCFSYWLSPIQVIILPVHHTLHLDYALKVSKLLKEQGVRVELNNEEEKISYRLRSAQVRKIPYTLVVGDKEMENETVTYRLYGNEKQVSLSLSDFIKLIVKEIKDKSLMLHDKVNAHKKD